jgi:diaminohydroxyphosphoribosylaminopyrimidine deaminase/5-amino-6-(5-phosphoribosylamino)uracil reductase
MDRCFRLARKGTGSVSPNPLVGAVLVKNGVKIGEGFHERFGGHHAEINAIRNALARKKEILGSTLYVNLEPCSHHGKTPPCVDAVIRHGIAKVVIGCMDPNPVVAGRGIALLRKNNITVRCGVRGKEAEQLNQAFFKHILTGRPFITLKAAQTSDGYIARLDGTSQWITNHWSRRYVHQLRNENDAVLVGSGTVLQDDPELTVRSVPGRNPVTGHP